MNRDITNIIRQVMDECIPPLVRDSHWFMYPFYRAAYGSKDLHTIMHFKALVHSFTPDEYARFYANLDSISRHRATDLNAPSLAAILDTIDTTSDTLLDVGAGKGYLLGEVQRRRPGVTAVGVDVTPRHAAFGDAPYVRGRIEALPFPDRSFDIVTCNHTLEHVLNLDTAIAELTRVTRKKLVVVTPRQRPYYYTLDEHINFFPYREALVSRLPFRSYSCQLLSGDWFYVGNVAGAV